MAVLTETFEHGGSMPSTGWGTPDSGLAASTSQVYAGTYSVQVTDTTGARRTQFSTTTDSGGGYTVVDAYWYLTAITGGTTSVADDNVAELWNRVTDPAAATRTGYLVQLWRHHDFAGSSNDKLDVFLYASVSGSLGASNIGNAPDLFAAGTCPTGWYHLILICNGPVIAIQVQRPDGQYARGGGNWQTAACDAVRVYNTAIAAAAGRCGYSGVVDLGAASTAARPFIDNLTFTDNGSPNAPWRTDNFNRANSTTALGSPSDGLSPAWTPTGRLGILSNRAYNPANTTASDYLDVGAGVGTGGSGTMSAQVIWGSGTGDMVGIRGHCGDTYSYDLYFDPVGSSKIHLARSAYDGSLGGGTLLFTSSATYSSGANPSLKMVVNANAAIDVYINGTYTATVTPTTDTNVGTGHSGGIVINGSHGTDSYIDDYTFVGADQAVVTTTGAPTTTTTTGPPAGHKLMFLRRRLIGS
jgi:hypothetical protein